MRTVSQGLSCTDGSNQGHSVTATIRLEGNQPYFALSLEVCPCSISAHGFVSLQQIESGVPESGEFQRISFLWVVADISALVVY